MTIPALPALSRTSPTFRADLDALFLTHLPATTGAINAAILDIDADVIAAAGSATAAAGSAEAADTARAAAQLARDATQAYAQSAVLAPGTSATSNTPLNIGAAVHALTVQTGKLFAVGQWLVVSSAADPANQMTGQVISHNTATGALSLRVDAGNTSGSGTFADWIIALTASPVATPIIVSATTNAATPVMTNSAAFLTYFLA